MPRRNIIQEVTIMTAAVYTDRARAWTRLLERAVAEKHGVAERDARTFVARKTGIAPGTLENIRNGRIKAIAVHVFDALRGAVEGELTREIARLEHELQMLRQSNADYRDDQISEVQAYLAKDRQSLEGKQ